MTYHVPVREWHSSEQPREKLAQLGAEHLSNAELLAILLRVGVAGQDVVSLSQALLTAHGGLVGLSRTPVSMLARTRGMGTAKAVTVQAALELGRRLVLADIGELPQIRTPQDVASMLTVRLGLREQEYLCVVILNTKNRVVGVKEVYHGSVNTSMVRVAEVFRDAIKENCPSIIVAHNHPSGDPTPSPEDVAVTREFIAAGKLLDIEVLDHLVIGRSSFVSMRQKRLGFD